ncbi:hypothetical protein NSQ62_07690 [Solibacillus sp. FSL H8-0523]|uniref:hypothetical protein n=1 Tax=Solibacillus sp. FSL H8-0523 TaxID=2954511 RepID=UPI00310135B8
MADPISYLKISKRDGFENFPVYSISDFPNSPLRIMTSSGIGCFNLVESPLSSPLRVVTADGIKGIITEEEVEFNLPPLAIRTVVYMKDKWMVSNHDGSLHLSEDGGRTFTKTMPIGAEVGTLKQFHIFNDGTLLFCSNTKAYYSTDFLTYRESTLLDKNGSPVVMTGVDSFNAFNHDRSVQVVDGVEMLVWGNYTHSNVRILVWYTVDKGRTLKIAYEFNAGGGNGAHHVHNVLFNPADSSFWIQTGDYFPPEVTPMSHFIKCFYNTVNDSWTFETIGSSIRFKSTNMVFYGDYAYWTWDTTNGGVIRCKYDEIGDITKHEQLFQTPNDCLDLIMSDRGEFIVTQSFHGGTEDARNIWYSPDRVTFHKILTNPDATWSTQTCYYGIRGPNSDGRVLAGVANSDSGTIATWDLKPSVFLDEFVRKAGFPNAFKPL